MIKEKGEREFEEQFVSYDCEKANGHPCHLEKHRIRIQSHHLKQSIALVEKIIEGIEGRKREHVGATTKPTYVNSFNEGLITAHNQALQDSLTPLQALLDHLQKRLQELS